MHVTPQNLKATLHRKRDQMQCHCFSPRSTGFFSLTKKKVTSEATVHLLVFIVWCDPVNITSHTKGYSAPTCIYGVVSPHSCNSSSPAVWSGRRATQTALHSWHTCAAIWEQCQFLWLGNSWQNQASSDIVTCHGLTDFLRCSKQNVWLSKNLRQSAYNVWHCLDKYYF